MKPYLYISDHCLNEINSYLNWKSALNLPDGRILGSLTSSKRTTPETIPDYRVKILNDLITLSDKSVLEIGCFEGAHTLSLLQYTDNVTAIDVRPKNVINTIIRVSLFGKYPKVLVYNTEDLNKNSFGFFDLIFHCGVLYHLKDPAAHLANLSEVCNFILLDTHVCLDSQINYDYSFNNKIYKAFKYGEGGWSDPFSGKDTYAVWLSKKDLQEVLESCGFRIHTNIEERIERNGTRICWLLERIKND